MLDQNKFICWQSEIVKKKVFFLISLFSEDEKHFYYSQTLEYKQRSMIIDHNNYHFLKN